jgi:diamine N-acetyltransferase
VVVTLVIYLRDIDETNREACVALRVREDQASLVASNSKSIKWARRNPGIVPRVIYEGKTVVGFLMYEPRGNRVFSVHRLMVDAQWQRRGVGRRAMELVIEEIRRLGGATIYSSTRPENEAAQCLLAELGFEIHEVEPDGEVVYRQGPPREFSL